MSVPSCSTSKGLNNETTKEEVVYGKWERFTNWVHCICIVTFDLELGQAIEVTIHIHRIIILIFS